MVQPVASALKRAVTSIAETIPSFEYIAWNGCAVTGGVPIQVTGRLAEALRTVALDPKW
jgi:hypothetical protein